MSFVSGTTIVVRLPPGAVTDPVEIGERLRRLVREHAEGRVPPSALRRGRGPTQVVRLRVSGPTLAHLDHLARALGVSVGVVLRAALRTTESPWRAEAETEYVRAREPGDPRDLPDSVLALWARYRGTETPEAAMFQALRDVSRRLAEIDARLRRFEEFTQTLESVIITKTPPTNEDSSRRIREFLYARGVSVPRTASRKWLMERLQRVNNGESDK